MHFAVMKYLVFQLTPGCSTPLIFSLMGTSSSSSATSGSSITWAIIASPNATCAATGALSITNGISGQCSSVSLNGVTYQIYVNCVSATQAVVNAATTTCPNGGTVTVNQASCAAATITNLGAFPYINVRCNNYNSGGGAFTNASTSMALLLAAIAALFALSF